MTDPEGRLANQMVECPRASLPQRRRKELEEAHMFRESTFRR